MARNEYIDPILKKIADKLELEGPVELRGKYRYGDILVPAKKDLPICTISKETTSVGKLSNSEDDTTVAIIINVIYDWTMDLNKSFDLYAGSTSLYRIIEGRENDYSLKDNTILKVLRKYQQIDSNMWLAVGPNENIRITYGLGIERRGQNIFSVEADMRFNARVIIAQPT